MPMLFDCQRYLISPGDKLFVAYRLFRTSVLLAAYCFASLDDVTFSFNLIQQCVCVFFLAAGSGWWFPIVQNRKKIRQGWVWTSLCW